MSHSGRGLLIFNPPAACRELLHSLLLYNQRQQQGLYPPHTPPQTHTHTHTCILLFSAAVESNRLFQTSDTKSKQNVKVLTEVLTEVLTGVLTGVLVFSHVSALCDLLVGDHSEHIRVKDEAQISVEPAEHVRPGFYRDPELKHQVTSTHRSLCWSVHKVLYMEVMEHCS